MSTFRVVYEIIVEADYENDAEPEAQNLIYSGKFEPAIIEELELLSTNCIKETNV